MNAAEAIIKKFGGQTALAGLIGKRQGTVGYWAKTGMIPAKWRPQLLFLAKENLIDLSPADFDNINLLIIPSNSNSLPEMKATHQGQLKLNGIVISCAVLNDGTRVISERSLANALGIRGGGAYWEKKKKVESEQLMPEYMAVNNLQPYISEALKERVSKSITYIPKASHGKVKSATGFPAEILPEICDAWIRANEKKALTENQQTVAKTAYKILKGFATVGIIALIDEATGYQYDRERFELQKILAAYIAEELLPWQKRFPDEFYREIFRLRKWNFTVSGIKQRPGVIGTWTKNLIYKQLPKGVLKELYNKTPKTTTGKLAARLHQSLTPDIGNSHLEKQLVAVITLMNISENWEQFEKHFHKKFGQQKLDFESVELIEPKGILEDSTWQDAILNQ